MGKGDKKTRRGKITIGSHGKRRPRKKATLNITKKAAPKPRVTPKAEVETKPKAAPKTKTETKPKATEKPKAETKPKAEPKVKPKKDKE